jgi:hypothetical protein
VSSRVGRYRRGAFTEWAAIGLAAGGAVALGATAYQGLSAAMMGATILAGLITFCVVVMVTTLITGEEQLVFYRQQIAVMAVAVAWLHLNNQPVLPFLDALSLGFAALLVCGRIGCLMVGCCHGRPSRWGIRYGPAHVADGAPSHLLGVQLFPVQALESFAAFCLLVSGVGILLGNNVPGVVTAWMIAGYGLVRACLEFLRGDPERVFIGGFSEAQWTSVTLLWCVSWAESFGLLPFDPWHTAAATTLTIVMIIVLVIRRVRPTPVHALLDPCHVREIAAAVAHGDADPMRSGIYVGTTSLGFRISATTIEAGRFEHCALSKEGTTLSNGALAVIADLILTLKHPATLRAIVRGHHDVVHLFLDRQPQSIAVERF